jgi:hypothetical protein
MDRRKEGVLSIGKVHFRLASRLCCVHGGSNPVEMQPHYWPLRSAQHYNRYLAATEVLLIAHVLIGRKKYVETRVLASANNSPLVSVSDPRSLAFVTV